MPTPIPATRRVAAIVTVGAVAAAAGVSGCGANPTPSTTGRLSVAAAFYPWQFVAQTVGGDAVRVTNLTKQGAEPHDLELTPRQVATLAKANLVIYERGLQPAVDKAVDEQAKSRAFDTTSVVSLRTHSSTLSEGSAHSDPLAGKDPHVWLDPILLVAVVRGTAQRLSAIRPDEATFFRDNAQRLTAELESLDRQIRAGLEHCQSRVIVTSHTAFGYFADRYNMQQVGVVGFSPDAEPTGSRIAQVSNLVRALGVSTVFYEKLVSSAIARTVALEAHVSTAVLDPLEGITAGNNYLTVMSANLAALRRGLHCA